jgi:hypothetical protein
MLYVFKLPPARVWFDVAFKLFDFFTNSPASGIKVVCPPTLVQRRGQSKQTVFYLQGFQLLRSILDVEGQFSEARCLKVLPLALAAYQENLPSHYSSQYHENKVCGEIWLTQLFCCLIELILCTRKRKPKHCFLVTEEVRLCKSFSVVWMSSAIDFGVTVGVCANSPALLAILAFNPCTELSAKRMVKTNYRFFLI